MNNVLISYKQAHKYLTDFISQEENLKNTMSVAELLAKALKNGNKVLSCGNGGSMCDAMHFAEEFTGKFNKDRSALPAIALSDPAFLTCVANDYGFERVFQRGVEAYGKKGDILFAISTSGNSQNIINAVQKAKKSGIKSIGFLGQKGGELKNLCDITFIVPAKTTDRIQEVHMIILHIIIQEVERILFPHLYAK